MARLLLIVLVLVSLPGSAPAQCVPALPLVTQSGYYAVPALPVAPVIVQAQYPIVIPQVPVSICPEPMRPIVYPRQAAPSPAPGGPAPSVSEFHRSERPARSYEPASTSFYRAAYYNPSEAPQGNGQALLTLNNASDRPLLVWVDGVRYLLIEDQSLKREVNRDFTWQVEGHDKQPGQVPQGEKGVRIDINR